MSNEEMTGTEMRLAAIKDTLTEAPEHQWTPETVAWLVARVESSRLAYRERFNEGLNQAQWHDKHCAASRSLRQVKDLHAKQPGVLIISEVKGVQPYFTTGCPECSQEWPCDTARAMGVTS